MLVLHSPVVADMFTFPHPAAVENYDGAPVVDMPDNAENLESFLKVLYNLRYSRYQKALLRQLIISRSALPNRRYDPDTPLLVAGVLRMATKYQIEFLRERIVQIIEADWPKTVEEWDAMEAHIELLEQEHKATFSRDKNLCFKIDGLYLD